jgi:hypothetical protein
VILRKAVRRGNGGIPGDARIQAILSFDMVEKKM